MVDKKDELDKDIDVTDDKFLDDIDSYLDDSLDDDFDIDVDTTKKGSRKPAVVDVKEVAKSMKPSMEDAAVLQKKIGAEFKGIDTGVQGTISIVSDIDRMKSDLLKDITPGINRLKNVSKRYLDKVEGSLPKSISSKLSSILETTKQDSRPSEEEQRTNAINEHISSIFGKQAELQQEQFVSEKVDGVIKGRIEEGRFKDTTTILSQIRNAAKSSQRFFETEFRQYLIKSLELKYRQLFVSQDTFKSIKSVSSVLESKLAAIVQNTGLPDIQKQHKSEEFRAHTREKLYGKASGKISEWASTYGSTVIENVKANIFDKAKEVIDQATDMSSDVLEGLADAKEMEEEFGDGDKTSFLTSTLASLTKSLLIDTGLVSAKALIGVQKFKDADEAMKNFTDNLPFIIDDYVEEKADDSALFRFIKDNIIPSKPDTVVSNVLKDQATEAVPFDVLTRRSIVEIIPGFLSKILQKSTELASLTRAFISEKLPGISVPTPDELVFDTSSEEYVTSKSFRDSKLSEMFGSKEDRTSQSQAIITTLTEAYTSSGGEASDIKEYLPHILRAFNNLAISKKIIKPKTIMKFLEGSDVSKPEQDYLDVIFEGIPEDLHTKIATMFKESLFRQLEDGEEVDNEATKDLNRNLRELMLRQDTVSEHLPELNSTGGKRFFKDMLSVRSADDIREFKEKLEREAVNKYGNDKFNNDPAIRKEIYDEVRKFSSGSSSVDRAFLDNMYNDVYMEDIDVKESNVNKYTKTKEAREEESTQSLSERFINSVDTTARERYGDSIVDRIAEALNKTEDRSEGSAYDLDIEDVSDETGIPTRDAAQISGPGVYFQGSDKELHIPYEEASMFFSKFSRSVMKGVQNAKDKFSGETPIVDQDSTKLDKDQEFWDTAAASFSDTFGSRPSYVGQDASSPVERIDETTSEIRDILKEVHGSIEEGSANTLGMLNDLSTTMRASLLGSEEGRLALLKLPQFKPIQLAKRFSKSMFKKFKIPFTLSKTILGKIGKTIGDLKDKFNPMNILSKVLGVGTKAVKGMAKAQLSILKKIGSTAKSMVLGYAGGKIQDIYAYGDVQLGKPLVKAQDILDGKVFTISGKLVTSSWNIKEALVDKNGNVLISNADIQKGLVSASGKKLTTMRLLKGAVSLTKKFIAGNFNVAKSMVSKGIGVAKGAAGLAVKGVKGLVSKIPGLPDLFSSSKVTNKLSKVTNDRLDTIIKLLEPISVKAIGLREGSYADHKRDLIEDRAKGDVFDKLENRNRSKNKSKMSATVGGALGMLGLGGSDEEGKGGGGLIDTATSTIAGGWLATKGAKLLKGVKGLGGKVTKIVPKGLTGKAGGLIARTLGRIGIGTAVTAGTAAAAETAAAAVGTGAAAGGSAAASGGLIAGLSNPVGWAILAGTAAVGGGIYLWSRHKKKKLRGKISDVNNNYYKIPSAKGYDLTEVEDQVIQIVREEKREPTMREYKSIAKELGYPKDAPMDHFVNWFKARFLPVLQRSVSIIEHKYHVSYDKSYKMGEEGLKSYKKVIDTIVLSLGIANAPGFTPDTSEIDEIKPLPITKESSSTTDTVKKHVAKSMVTIDSHELAPMTEVVAHKTKFSTFKKIAKRFILPWGIGSMVARKILGPNKFAKERMSLYGVPSDRFKSCLVLEREMARKLEIRAKIGDTFIKATAKEFGFDIDIKEQLAYVHTWLKHVFAPMFVLVNSILKTNGYSYDDINDIPDELVEHVLGHLRNAKQELSLYKEFVPTIAGYMRFTTKPAIQRKGFKLKDSSGHLSARGTAVTKALTGKDYEDNFVDSVDKFNTAREKDLNDRLKKKFSEAVQKEQTLPLSRVKELSKSNVQQSPIKPVTDIKTDPESKPEEVKPVLEDQLSTLDKILATLEHIKNNGETAAQAQPVEEKSSFYFDNNNTALQRELTESIKELVSTLGGSTEQDTSQTKFLRSINIPAKRSSDTVNTKTRRINFSEPLTK